MSDKYGEGFFPRYIDRPRLIGVFEMDEFMVVFGLIAGIIAGSLAVPQVESLIVMVTAIITGLSSGIAYKKFKNGRPTGFTAHFLYKKGLYHPVGPQSYISYPYLKDNKGIPFGFTKELIS